MSGLVLLIIASVVARATASAARLCSRSFGLSLVGWWLAMLAAWAAAGAAGALFEWWPILPIGFIGVLSERAWLGVSGGGSGGVSGGRRGQRGLWITADLLVIVLSGLASGRWLGATPIVTAALLFALAGWTLDRLFMTVPRRWCIGLVTVSLLLLVAGTPPLVAYMYRAVGFRVTPLFRLGATAVRLGQQVELDHGGAAYVTGDLEGSIKPAVLMFHGADDLASHQSASCMLRNALLNAGFVVLSVDHLGYGRSEMPALDGPVAAWDPLPICQNAFQRLRSEPAVGSVVLMGHSMGCTDVMRVLEAGGQVDQVVLCGGGAGKGARSLKYWYDRFHKDRRLNDRIEWEKFKQISDLYYDRHRRYKALRAEGPKIWYVRYDLEVKQIAASGDRLYDMIDGEKEKVEIVGSTHNMNSRCIGGMLIADVMVLRQLSRDLARPLMRLARAGEEKQPVTTR